MGEQKKKISCYLLSFIGNTFINKNTRKKNSQKNRKTLLEMSKKNCITCNFFFGSTDRQLLYTNVHLLIPSCSWPLLKIGLDDNFHFHLSPAPLFYKTIKDHKNVKNVAEKNLTLFSFGHT